MSLKRDLDQFAATLLAEAKTLCFEEKMDAFKALTSYYVGTSRLTKKPPAGNGAGESFADLKSDIAKAGTEYDA